MGVGPALAPATVKKILDYERKIDTLSSRVEEGGGERSGIPPLAVVR